MNPSVKINLEYASALAVDDNPQALELLCSILAALGIKDIVRCVSAAEGMDACQRRRFDLVITDGQMPEMDGYEFVHWIRRTGPVEGRLVPVLVFTAHSRRSQVMRARDCGANFIVSKPLSPKILLERIYWVAKATRMFIECETYVGPDRRFKMQGPPAEFPDGRRRDDVAGDLNAAAGDNLSQEELSAMIAPQKVSL